MARLRSVAVVSALGMIAAGAVTTATVSAADAATNPPTIKVFVTKTHTVRMATSMRPGVHRFVVRSGKEAGFQIAKLAPGYSKAEVSRDVNKSMNAQGQPDLKALKRFEKHATFLGGVSSAPGHRGVMYVDLPRGRYVALDTNLRVEKPGKLLSFTVGGHRLDARMPKASTLKVVDEITFKGAWKIPHAGLLDFDNRSVDNHFVEFAKLAQGKTMKDVRAWMKKSAKGEDAGPPPVDMSVQPADSGVVSPGHRMTMRYSLPRGHYVLLCWWPDADMGGMPHAFMGMYRGTTLY